MPENAWMAQDSERRGSFSGLLKAAREGLTDLVRESLGLRVPNKIHLDGPLVAELLKDRKQHAGIAKLHPIDPLEHIVGFETDLFEESRRHHAREDKSIQLAFV